MWLLASVKKCRNIAPVSHHYIFVIVRKDLPVEVQMVQVGHACYEAAHDFTRPEKEVWMVLLHAQNEEHLGRASDLLYEALGIRNYIFNEPDLGNAGEYTALCTEPISSDRKNEVSKFLKDYPKWSYNAVGTTPSVPSSILSKPLDYKTLT